MEYIKRVIFIASVILCINLSAFSQSISLNNNDITIKEAIEQLKKTSGYSFVFSSVDIDTSKHISLSLEDATVDEAVQQILQGQKDIAYEISGKKIILKKTTSVLTVGNKEKITGRVIDGNGDPIIGATIVLKGATTGTITDIDGYFSLDAVSDSILEISYIGYQTQQLKAVAGSILVVSLKENAQLLDEVVVIGYGTTTRKDFTGSVSSMKLENSPVALVSNTNALEALKGSVGGLDIGATNMAGEQPSMLMRGQNSISGNNDPLLIVDGVIFLGNLNDINPNDIAIIDVLKDASSAAAYGSRSANGVIAITTKRGKSGKPVINLNVTGTMQSWHRQPEFMDGESYLQMLHDKNGTTVESLSTQQRTNYEAGNETNWLDEISRKGWLQDYQVSVSGAGEKMNYYLSTSYTDNKGIIIGDDFSRITMMAKISTDITDWLKIGADASYTYSDYSGVGAEYNRAVLLGPYDVMYRKGVDLLERYPLGSNTFENPLWKDQSGMYDNLDIRRNFRINAHAVVKLPWVKGLSYRVNYSAYMNVNDGAEFYHEGYYAPLGAYDDDSRYSDETVYSMLGSTNGYYQNAKTDSWVVDNILNYKNTFGNHSIDLTAVATRDSKLDRWDKMEGRDYVANGNTNLGYDGLQYATTQKTNTGITRRRNAGYFARGSYSYDDRYYLTASYRRDGASVFGEDNKWGNFFAFGGAYRITREDFMKDVKFLNDLKLKLSWGRNGNQGISPYGTLSGAVIGPGGGIAYPFGNSTVPSFGIRQSSLGNSSLGWETTDSWNVGFESTWLDNRLFVNMDVYLSKTTDQIFNRTIPSMTGFESMMSTMGEVANRGVEFSIHSVNIKNKDWRWDTNLTFWLNRNKLVRLYGEDLDGDGKEDDDLGNNLFIGHSIHSIYGYKVAGIVQKDDTEYIQANGAISGNPKYVDMDGNGTIGVEDRTILGTSDSRFRMSLSNTLSWKNLELYFMLTGTFGGNEYYVSENMPAFLAGGGGGGAYSNNMYIPYWTEDRPGNKYPAANFGGDGRFKGLQSRAFVRLQDVTLSYTVNSAKIKNLGVNNLRIFFTGKNLFTITGWENGDPELGNTILSATYPISTNLSLGANISF
ncbi:MAG: TonB-dependent receptor [Tannerellaceae bacterium]|jgi:TonB-linked SusC/RagA family outer membrane protein|nr:TonB-dependent receptor [Tannerellaceae bacterium]